MKHRLLTKKSIMYVLLAIVACTALGYLIYWRALPEQQVRFAFAQANRELDRPFGTLQVVLGQQAKPACENVLKNFSKTGPSMYAQVCRVSHEGFAYIQDDATTKRFRDAAGPLGNALQKHGWRLQPPAYDAITWMNMLAARATNSTSVNDLDGLLYRKQMSAHTFCEFDMLASDKAAGQTAVHVALLCQYSG